ncbi:MAG: hypothetical protein HY831_01530 [Candidatus Aenigmarchaeota archaeon]|nr:hypothetical protein [Candidatus Aenigmarchaeota archaeon]
MKDIFKNWKVLLLIFLVVISVILIAPNFSPQGVTVTFKAKNSTIPLVAGDIIYKINDKSATIEDLQKDYEGVVKLSTNKGDKLLKINGTLGLEVKNTPSTKISFGLDIEGGVRAVIKPQSDNVSLEQIISTLQTRINIYGLREANFRSIKSDGQGFVEIIMAGGNREELRELLERQGNFEAKIDILAKDGKTLEFQNKYPIEVSNNTININGTFLRVNDTVELDTVKIKVNSILNNTANLSTLVFTGKDIILVYSDPQRSGIEQIQGGYRWSFQVQLSQEGAQRFAYVTKNLDRVFSTSDEGSLSSKIDLYLDGDLIDSLGISASLKGQSIQTPSITGYGADAQTATKTQRTLQTILKSGSLPSKIEIVQLEVISPNLGASFLTNILLAITAAVVAVSIIVAIRYRKKGIVIPMLVTSMSEVMIIFGASVVIGWTIDIASIAAIIAIIGTGIDAQIIMIDQSLREGDKTITAKERIKRALFIILGAGGTVIGAMLPLTVLGLGVLRGFAITTILGVLIGIFITRPAFGEIIKKQAHAI